MLTSIPKLNSPHAFAQKTHEDQFEERDLDRVSSETSAAEDRPKETLSDLQKSFIDFLVTHQHGSEEDAQFSEILAVIHAEFLEFAEIFLIAPSDIPDLYSSESVRKCLTLFRGLIEGVLNSPKLKSKNLKTASNVRIQILKEKKFLEDLAKTQSNPRLTDQAKAKSIHDLIKKGLLGPSGVNEYMVSPKFETTPIVKLISELLAVSRHIGCTLNFDFDKPLLHHLLVNFFIENSKFDFKTCDFNMSTKDYVYTFGEGFAKTIIEGRLVNIYKEFLKAKHEEILDTIRSETDAFIALQQIRVHKELEKQFHKELALERRNFFKNTEKTLTTEFEIFEANRTNALQAFFAKAVEISKKEFEAQKTQLMQNLTRDFYNFLFKTSYDSIIDLQKIERAALKSGLVRIENSERLYRERNQVALTIENLRAKFMDRLNLFHRLGKAQIQERQALEVSRKTSVDQLSQAERHEFNSLNLCQQLESAKRKLINESFTQIRADSLNAQEARQRKLLEQERELQFTRRNDPYGQLPKVNLDLQDKIKEFKLPIITRHNPYAAPVLKLK